MAALDRAAPGNLTTETAACTTAIARVRVAMKAAEQDLQQGQLRQAAGEIGTAIQELMALHGTLVEAHVARGQRALVQAQLPADPPVRGTVHHERRPALALRPVLMQEIH